MVGASAQRDGIAAPVTFRPEDASTRLCGSRRGLRLHGAGCCDRPTLDPGDDFSGAPHRKHDVLSNLQKLEVGVGASAIGLGVAEILLGRYRYLPVCLVQRALRRTSRRQWRHRARTHALRRSREAQYLLGNPREISQSRRQRGLIAQHSPSGRSLRGPRSGSAKVGACWALSGSNWHPRVWRFIPRRGRANGQREPERPGRLLG